MFGKKDKPIWIALGVAAVLAIIGMVVQFAVYKKYGVEKPEKSYDEVFHRLV